MADIDFDDDDVIELDDDGEAVEDVTLDFDFQFESRQRQVFIEFKTLKDARDAAKQTFDHLDKQLRKAKAIVHDRMKDPEDIGMDTVKIPGVGRFSAPEPTWYATVQDRGAFQKWARENRPGLLRTREEQALLNSLVRERIADGQGLPPGLGAYPRKKVSVYKR